MRQNLMFYSQNGLHLTEHFEQCRLVAYQDDKGVWTIGWGHTYSVKPNDTCTQAQADSWLLSDVEVSAYVVNSLVRVALSQGEFDALVDFVFNLGSGNFAHSTLLRLLNQGNFAAAATEFDRWDKITVKDKWGHPTAVILQGLLKRRETETQNFTGSVGDIDLWGWDS